MRSLTLLGLLLLPLVALGQSEAGNHGDPFRKEWRRQKLRAREILKKMTVERLLPNAAPEVRDWLSQNGPNNKSKFDMLEEELTASPLDFTEITKENPEGHNPDRTCAHTSQTPGDTIWISKVDCGKISPLKMWEVLIGDTVHHFKFGDEFSDYVSMDIVQGYRFHAETDPTFALRDRYKGIYRGKQTILTIDVAHAQPLKLSGGLEIDLQKLPALGGSGSKYGTSGDYSSFSYSTWLEGVGEDENGKLGYGELEGTRRYHTQGLDMHLYIAIDSENDAILLTGYREVKGRDTDKNSESFTIAMLHYPPTAEELEAKRLAANAVALNAILDKKPEQFQKEDETAAIELLNSGVSADYTQLVEKAVRRRFWKLVDLTAPTIPQEKDLTNLVFNGISAWDAEQVREVLAREVLKKHINLASKQNNRTALGAVIDQLNDRNRKETLSERETKLVPIIESLLDSGVKTNEFITDVVNTPRLPLSAVVGRFGVSTKSAEAIIKRMPEGEIMKPDDKDRTAYDYMAFWWNLVRTHCGPIAQNIPEAKARYEDMDNRYGEIYLMMKNAGHNGERRGCFYYDKSPDRPVCEYEEKTKLFRLFLKSEYRTKPRNWAAGTEVPAHWDICG